MTLFTYIHVLISLVGIFSGFIVIFGMMGGRPLPRWTAVFLAATVATSVTGFMFPIRQFTPAIGTGIVSLIVLTFTLLARYRHGLAGGWRRTYALTAVFAQYLNVFVLVVQSFLKIPALHALAPNGNEPPFAAAQGVVLIAFIGLGIAAARGFRAVS
jgi:hypothetical protein